MAELFGFLKVVVICFAGLIALFLILLSLPRSPLKDLVMRFMKPVAITAAAAAIGTDITATLPIAGEVGDLGLLAFVGWAWLNYFKEIKIVLENHSASVGPKIIKQ